MNNKKSTWLEALKNESIKRFFYYNYYTLFMLISEINFLQKENAQRAGISLSIDFICYKKH